MLTVLTQTPSAPSAASAIVDPEPTQNNSPGVRHIPFATTAVDLARAHPCRCPVGPQTLLTSGEALRIGSAAHREGRQRLQTFSTAPPDSTQSLKPPRFRTSLYPRSCNVLPASADRPPEAQ